MFPLLEVQKAARLAANGKRGFAYYMEMGLGKTLTALSEFTDLVAAGEATRLVVFCPNSFKSGWVAEIRKQEIAVDPFIFHSGSADNDYFIKKRFEKPPVLIINYEALRREHVQEYIERFIHNRKCMLVIDESIQIKTHNSQQTKAVLSLAQEFDYVRVLSGKPTTQGPQDLWAQMRAIGHMNGTNFYAFRNTFCKMGGYLNKKVVGTQNEDILAMRIKPHVFWAKKTDWLDLPPKIYTIRECQLEPQQLRQYYTMEKEFVTWLQSGEHVSVDMAITKYIKLAQIQFGFLINEEGVLHELVEPAKNPRINLIKDVLDNEVQDKFIVVYHHKYAGQVLANQLHEYGMTFITGGMTPDQIGANTVKFNEEPDCRGILVQDTAGRYGHTLIGSPKAGPCSAMIFAENTWSLDTRSQLEDRPHRTGMFADSLLYVDIASTPLDRRVANALQMKQSVFDAVFKFLEE